VPCMTERKPQFGSCRDNGHLLLCRLVSFGWASGNENDPMMYSGEGASIAIKHRQPIIMPLLILHVGRGRIVDKGELRHGRRGGPSGTTPHRVIIYAMHGKHTWRMNKS